MYRRYSSSSSCGRRPAWSGWWLLFAFLWPWVCSGQGRMKFNRFDRYKELADNIIYRIAEDKQGFLWLATYNGLLRYDGYTFTAFQHDPDNDSGIAAGPVIRMHPDRRGMFWLSIQGGGIDMFDPLTGKARHYRFMDGNAPATNFTSIAEDAAGNLWFASTVQGIFRLDPASGKVRHYPMGPNKNIDELHILADRSGGVWMNSMAHGLHRYEAGQDKVLPVRSVGGVNFTSNHIFQGRAGLMWMTDEEYLNAYLLPNWKKVHSVNLTDLKPAGENTVLTSAMQDRDGKIWISTNSKGLIVYDTGSRQHRQFCYDRDDPNGLPTNNLNCVYEDKAGNIWIGSGKGLFKLSPLQARIRCFVYTRPESDPALSTSSIRSVFAPPGDVVWAGSAGTGLHAIEKDGTITAYFYEGKTGRPGYNSVNDIAGSRSGELLLGTGHGLWMFDPVRREYTARYPLTSIPGKGELAVCAVWATYEDKDGFIWVGTKYHGLLRLDRRTGEVVVAEEAYSRSEAAPGLLKHVWCIYPDRDGVVWLGTGDGLKKVVIRNGKAHLLKDYKPDKTKEGALRGSNIFRITKDSNGNIWVATTEGGLSRLNVSTGTFRTFRTDDGLPSNSVASLEKDRSGLLWVSTAGGLCVVDPLSERVLRSYDASDGLLSNHYNFGSSAASADGHLYFGSSGGVERFRPERIRRNTFRPRLALNSFRVLYHERLNEMLRDSFVSLNYDENSFSVEFASLDFTNPEKNTFSYRLAGLNDEWQVSGTRHYAAFTNLAPGNYTLYIRGTNSEGLLSDKIATFRIQILPPFWRTWWFYLLCGMAAAGTGAYVLSIIIRRKDAERQRVRSELTALRAQLNPHFMFNSLSALQRFIMNGEEEPALRYLTKFSRLLRKILENSRYEWITLREELEFLELYFYMENLRMNYKVKFLLETDPTLDPDIIRVPSMLLQPLVENSLVHGLVAGKENGFVKVSFIRKEDGLLCVVEDNGVGRSQAQANSENSVHKSSLGMKLIEERLALLSAEGSRKATITITDLTDAEGKPAGIRTEIHIPEPVLKKHYA